MTVKQLEQLDNVFSELLLTLEKGRNDIFDIAEDCHKQLNYLEVELAEVKYETGQIIVEVEKHERLERHSRNRLAQVSKAFHYYSEQDIKEAYENARILQLKLLDLHQKEMYLRKRRDEISRQIKQFTVMTRKADNFLESTGLALKILQGNLEKINDTIEQSYRKEQMETWIIESQEAERRKIARDLHDGPAQNLSSMLIRLDLIKRLADSDQSRVDEEWGNIREMGKESLEDVRRIMFDLKPILVHGEGLSSSLKDYFRDYESKYNFDIDFVSFGEDRKLSLSLEIALFRLVQEAITNVRKHSGMNKAMVKIENTRKDLYLVIKDEGIGFDLKGVRANKESYGIIGMQERVQLIRGSLDIVSSPGSGTQVIIKVPWEEEAGNGQSESYNS